MGQLYCRTSQRRPLLGQARGVYLRDVDGNRCLDGCPGEMVCNAGHSNPHVLEVMRRRMENSTCGYQQHSDTEASRQPAAREAALCPERMKTVLSHLYMLRHFARCGLIRSPCFVRFVFGVPGGMRPDPKNLTHVIRIADKLFAGDYLFSVLAAGRFQMSLITIAAAMGKHVRVGLKDNLTIVRGLLAHSNAEQVEKTREIVERPGRVIMTPHQEGVTLGLNGAGQVNA